MYHESTVGTIRGCFSAKQLSSCLHICGCFSYAEVVSLNVRQYLYWRIFYFSTISTEVILTGVTGLLCSPPKATVVGAVAILSTVSIPCVTLPKMT